MQIKKTIFSFILAATAIVVSLHVAHAQDIWEKERQMAKSLVTTEKLHDEISFLSDTLCQGRATGTEGSLEAARYISQRFEDAGLSRFGYSWLKQFHIGNNLKGTNVIGFLPGSKSIPCNRYVIVGAHYDHIGTIGDKMYPGADANASGVAAMTSLAEMFGKMRKMGRILRHNIIFVAFDAKELGFKGSEAFWHLIEYERLIDPVTGERISRDKISLMVNIDQIGSMLAPLRQERPDYLIMLGTPSLRKDLQDVLEECNRRPDSRLDIGLDYYGSKNFTKVFYRLSDQRIFVDNHIPAVFFTSGITMRTNKTTDTPESLDMEVLQRRIRLMFHWLEHMINN